MGGVSTFDLVHLGQVCTVVAGQSPKAAFYNREAKGVPFYQGKKEFSERYLGKPTTWTENVTKEAQAGDILMSVRAPVGPINEATETICIGRGLAAIRPSASVLRDYLWYALTWLQPQIKGNSGAVFDSINKATIEKLEFPLPPLEEQRRIVEVLDKAFEGLARARTNAETNLANARELLAVSLDEIFGSDNPTWKIAGLSDLCVIGDGNHSSKYPKKSEMVPDGVPFLRSGNIQNGEIDRGEMLYISEAKHAELKKGHLKSGDILFTNRGEIGKVAIVPDDLEGSNLNSQVAWLRCQGDLNNRFLFFFLQSARMKQHYLDTQSGAALQQFTIKMLKTVAVRFPSLPEQEAAVKRMTIITNDISRLASAYQATTTDLDDLRQSLLQKAFSGELT